MKDTEQRKLDGGTISTAVLHARRHARFLFGFSREEAAERVPEDAETWVFHTLKHLASDFSSEKSPVVALEDYEHEYAWPDDLGPTEWLVDECDMDLRTAMDYAPLEWALEEVPKDVVEVTLNPREWLDRLDRAKVFHDLHGDEVYWVVVKNDASPGYTEDGFAFVDDWGSVYSPEMYAFVDDDYEGYVWTGDEDDAPDIVYRETFRDYANTLAVIMPDTSKWVFDYDRGVVAWQWYDENRRNSEYDVDDVFDIAEPLIQGTYHVSTDAWRGYDTGPTATAEMVRVKSGWHSSMERTDISDRINELVSGKAHEAYGWAFPVVVMYGKTSNIMSIGLDIYAPEDGVDDVTQFFGDRSAGFKGSLR